jgi:choline dehydrogenase-like flavoprotein
MEHGIDGRGSIEANVAVVGAGPMGIVTALELARGGIRVALVESGGMAPSPAEQRLSDWLLPENSDEPHVPANLAVRRQVGGTTATWGGRCVPFDPIDFKPRGIVPEPLWPVTYDEFCSHLRSACDWCMCGDAAFNANDIPELANRELIPGIPDGPVRFSDLERWSLPTRFGKVYGRALEEHPLIELVTGATCTNIACDANKTEVRHLELRSLDNQRAILRADAYVIAAGGLESTRLLLASNGMHEAGIGNHSGHLGRWYMAHVQGHVARMHLSTPPELTIYGYERDRKGVYVRRRITFSEDLLREGELRNGATWIVNPELGDAAHGSGILSGVYLTLISPLGRLLLAEALRQAGTKSNSPSPIAAHLRNVVRDLVPAARFAVSFIYSRYLRRGRKAPGFFLPSAANVYPLQYHGEHLPHWESRVTLSEERDELGVPRLRTHVHFDDEDVRSVRTAMEHIDSYLRQHRAGHLEYTVTDIEAAVRAELASTAGYHQTGTTRMSRDPEDGVVTPELRVHGIDNLFVAAPSVFPTSSQANPTLTAVAFAVRLAEHLLSADSPRRTAT